MSESSVENWALVVVGLVLTSMSLSPGFIWACGAPCVSESVIWTSPRKPLLVFGASFTAWWGYLIAHYGSAGHFVDESAHDTEDTHEVTADAVHHSLPIPQIAGVIGGVAILVLGMVVGVIYIKQGNHLLTNVGGAFFLGGFVIAHFFETGTPL